MPQIDRYDRIFGLAIGIEKYDSHEGLDNLDGVKPTLENVEKWMKQEVGIPDDDFDCQTDVSAGEIDTLVRKLGDDVNAAVKNAEVVGVIVYLAGHGKRGEDESKLASFFANPDIFPFLRIQKEYQTYLVNAHHVLFILDCCHSGEALQPADASTNVEPPRSAPTSDAYYKKACLLYTSPSPRDS